MRGRAARKVLLALALGAVAAFVVREHVASLYRIPSASMVPTLLGGDVVVVDRLAYRSATPARGDVVVFEKTAPDGDPEAFAKRVVAVEGDVVRLDGRALVVGETTLARTLHGEAQLDAAGDPVGHASFFFESELWNESLGERRWMVLLRKAAPARETGPWTVPAGHVFVLGDNRDESVDSRDPSFGAVPAASIVGRVTRVVVSRAEGKRFRWARTGMRVE